MTVEPFWAKIEEAGLRQGDYLPQCLVPIFGADIGAGGTHDVAADDTILSL
jgi:hypothetical protein